MTVMFFQPPLRAAYEVTGMANPFRKRNINPYVPNSASLKEGEQIISEFNSAPFAVASLTGKEQQIPFYFSTRTVYQ